MVDVAAYIELALTHDGRTHINQWRVDAHDLSSRIVFDAIKIWCVCVYVSLWNFSEHKITVTIGAGAVQFDCH